MFGDVGHGILLLLVGLLLLSHRIKPLDTLSQLGGIIVTCGAASLLFGMLYGSLFGYEDVLPALWLRPLDNTEEILVATVVFGVATLAIGIIFNIVSCAQRQAWGRMLFSNNGLAGLIFFLSLVGLGAGLISPTTLISVDILLPALIVSALAITLGGVLEPLVEGHALDRSKLGMTIMEGFFELFESVISLMSNTLSYVRMGAFAVAHGALSLVIFILAELISPGKGLAYWVVVIFGTIFVVGFEGMIVAIQTLRLEYYEFFSKFFIGGGIRYNPVGLLPTDHMPV
jgi:V/A-type H+-transporting ATPase subunit I